MEPGAREERAAVMVRRILKRADDNAAQSGDSTVESLACITEMIGLLVVEQAIANDRMERLYQEEIVKR